MANSSNLAYSRSSFKTVEQISARQLEPKFPPLHLEALFPFSSNYLQRGSIAQITGPRSSGRTALALNILATSTQAGEVAAIIDLADVLAPASAQIAGVRLEKLLWVRCQNNSDHALKVTDLLLHAGGFGVVLLDLCDATPQALNRIPLSFWYRCQRVIENTPTILLICGEKGYAQGSLLTAELQGGRFLWAGKSPFRVLRGLESAITLSSGNQRPGNAEIEATA
jgi:hypothetical protein